MPTKEELEDAIYKYEHTPVSYQNCQSLAMFYYLYDKLYGDSDEGYSEEEFRYKVGPKKFWEIFDELLEALQVLNPKLYQSVIQKLEG
jgi:hypothetical protein